jgi:hypothetical protein
VVYKIALLKSESAEVILYICGFQARCAFQIKLENLKSLDKPDTN